MNVVSPSFASCSNPAPQVFATSRSMIIRSLGQPSRLVVRKQLIWREPSKQLASNLIRKWRRTLVRVHTFQAGSRRRSCRRRARPVVLLLTRCSDSPRRRRRGRDQSEQLVAMPWRAQERAWFVPAERGGDGPGPVTPPS
jgi:hypothetical protein